ncbi:hypothetical protein [Pseudomonas sp. NPDC090208]|uniref:hypothetical protein n=1 Tax=Pseudomonas sp. NPDC090208 TaxID=3364478 RepID=UPI003817DF21
MAISLIAATLIHIIWLSRAYQHINPEIQKRVRAASAAICWVLTCALFVLVQQALQDRAFPENYLPGSSASGQVIRVIASPDNSVCYAEIRSSAADQR